jgi:hypothetical protein
MLDELYQPFVGNSIEGSHHTLPTVRTSRSE